MTAMQWLCGWRTGLPKRNGEYLFQATDGTYGTSPYFVGGQWLTLREVARWKRLS